MRKVMTSVIGLSFCALGVLLSGCVSVPMASVDQDARAKAFVTSPDKASLYIYRNDFLGAVIPVSVAINGKTLGKIAGHTYFNLNVKPGEYRVESNVGMVPAAMRYVTVEAGKSYYLRQQIKWAGAVELLQVDESTGRAGVMESKRVAAAISDDDLVPKEWPFESGVGHQ